jgi:hypothetical protein
MQLIKFISDPPLTAFAPSWNYVLGESYITEPHNDFFKGLCNMILLNKDDIIQRTQREYEDQNIKIFNDSFDGYTGLGPNSLTSRSNLFNLLAWPEFAYIKTQILEKYLDFLEAVGVQRRKVYINSWANVLAKGQYIKPHLHSVGPLTYLGGHISLTENDTCTVYINPINQLNDPIEHKSKNEVGKITLFQNNIPHYTTENKIDSPRVTMAFDIMVEEQFVLLPKLKQEMMVILDDPNI